MTVNEFSARGNLASQVPLPLLTPVRAVVDVERALVPPMQTVSVLLGKNEASHTTFGAAVLFVRVSHTLIWHICYTHDKMKCA